MNDLERINEERLNINHMLEVTQQKAVENNSLKTRISELEGQIVNLKTCLQFEQNENRLHREQMDQREIDLVSNQALKSKVDLNSSNQKSIVETHREWMLEGVTPSVPKQKQQDFSKNKQPVAEQGLTKKLRREIKNKEEIIGSLKSELNDQKRKILRLNKEKVKYQKLKGLREKELKDENENLSTLIDDLKDKVKGLKQELSEKEEEFEKFQNGDQSFLTSKKSSSFLLESSLEMKKAPLDRNSSVDQSQMEKEVKLLTNKFQEQKENYETQLAKTKEKYEKKLGKLKTSHIKAIEKLKLKSSKKIKNEGKVKIVDLEEQEGFEAKYKALYIKRVKKNELEKLISQSASEIQKLVSLKKTSAALIQSQEREIEQNKRLLRKIKEAITLTEGPKLNKLQKDIREMEKQIIELTHEHQTIKEKVVRKRNLSESSSNQKPVVLDQGVQVDQKTDIINDSRVGQLKEMLKNKEIELQKQSKRLESQKRIHDVELKDLKRRKETEQEDLIKSKETAINKLRGEMLEKIALLEGKYKTAQNEISELKKSKNNYKKKARDLKISMKEKETKFKALQKYKKDDHKLMIEGIESFSGAGSDN